ncbi:polynucleotide 3'-phosphatase [Penicillium verhagenii]|nr:polynucleotide 3'-phosphatase [Penicillium verhagenii]
MSREQVRQSLRPSSDVSNQILSWLNSENISPDSIELDGNWITFQAAVFQAERMLNTEFCYFKNKNSNTTAVRALEYSVPSDLHSHILLIQPTTRFGDFSSLRGLSDEPPLLATAEDFAAGCGTVVTPSCLRYLYGLDNTTATPDLRNRLGIAGFLEEYARHGDLFQFMQVYAPEQIDANFTVVSINGGQNDENSSKDSIEASLDLQYAISIAYRAFVTFYTTGGRGPVVSDGEGVTAFSTNEPYLEQLHHLVNLPDNDLPAVITMSYGESEQSVPKSYATASCNLFAQLGARGVSVIFSSGDSGPGSSCQSNDGSYRAKFLPTWPASCPFVTSVGGTTGVGPETAISFSGGGFSDYFGRPSYQDRPVQSFLNRNGAQWKGLFNPAGRGIPDISAQAARFMVRDHGVYVVVGGTSASAPVVAGIISQLNAIRLGHGKPRLGFINPWLYTTGQSGLTDIIEGGSRGCAGSPVHNAGWNATVGWDPVTGLGTPFFPILEELAMF